MRLFRITQRAGEITSCGFNAGLSQIPKHAVRKPFGDFLEDLHRFSSLSSLLLILQLSTIGIKLRCIGLLERLIPNGFRLILLV